MKIRGFGEEKKEKPYSHRRARTASAQAVSQMRILRAAATAGETPQETR
jgi:hypothetical protein